MIPILRALMDLFSTEPPGATHDELDHRHWDRETRTWRAHIEQERREDDAAA